MREVTISNLTFEKDDLIIFRLKNGGEVRCRVEEWDEIARDGIHYHTVVKESQAMMIPQEAIITMVLQHDKLDFSNTN